MKKVEALSFRKGDIIAIGAVLLLGVVILMAFLPRNNTKNPVVQVYLDGKLIHELPLDATQSLPIDGAYHNIVAIQDGAVWVASSDCPGEDCVHSGKITQAGRSIVCLPNRMEVRITGDSEIDAVVR